MINPNKPESYFFTESAFAQSATNKSFGPLSENEFQITTKFAGAHKAFAVTSGTLFYAQFGTYEDKVNAILKPDGDIGLGLKIKYFIYRGLNFNEIYYKDNGEVKTKPKNAPDILQFLDKVWDEYIEFNGTDEEFDGEKTRFETGDTPKKLLSKFFKNSEGTSLLHVTKGTHIGTFVDGFGGFEIVLDDGDFDQDHSDTFLNFDEKFITATESILKVNGNHTSSGNDRIFGSNTEGIEVSGNWDNENIFRENVYRFLDPAAFYGAHVIVNNATNSGKINIYGHTDPINTPNDIFDDIVSKFINKKKTYIYIKEINGRSYNFYKKTTNPIKIGANSSTSIGESFEYEKWPIKCIEDNFQYNFSLENIETTNCKIYCNTGLPLVSNLGFLDNKQLLIDPKIPIQKKPITFIIPNKNIPFSSIIYLSYSDEDSLNNLFGNINLKTIFEKEDFGTTSNNIAYVNHLRPALIKDGYEVGLYNTKLVLEGSYISTSQVSTVPLPSDAELAKNLRTYIISPIKTTKRKYSLAEECSINAGYLTKSDETDNNASYTKGIYGQGEIWKGKIIDNIDSGANIILDSLSYRRKDNDEDLPIYQLGITQLDYKNLTTGIPTDATNLFFVFENEQSPANGSFLRYSVKIEYDDKNGDKQPPNSTSKAVYTVDGFFFFTKDYSQEFTNKPERYKEFANIEVDFLPSNLSSFNNGYVGGLDYVWYDASPTNSDVKRDYFDLFGKYFNTTTGLFENIPPDNPANYVFKVEKIKYLRYLSTKYNSKPTNWRNYASEYAFHTDSFITLYPKPHSLNNHMKVKLQISLDVKPSKLYIRYNKKYVSINDNNATASTGDDIDDFLIEKINYDPTINNNLTIDINSLQESETDIPLEVIAEYGSIKKHAGKCWIRKNKSRYTIDIVLVNCKTNLNGTPMQGLAVADTVKLKIENYLRQILINPKFNYDIVDLTSDNVFVSTHTSSAKIKSTYEMFDYVRKKLTNDEYKKMLVLLFFDEECVSSLAGEATIINNYVGGAIGARIFREGLSNTKDTVAHETLHSIGLYHSFDNDGEFTLKKYSTNNIMDYSSTRKLIWYWQDTKVKDTSNNCKLNLEI